MKSVFISLTLTDVGINISISLLLVLLISFRLKFYQLFRKRNFNKVSKKYQV